MEVSLRQMVILFSIPFLSVSCPKRQVVEKKRVNIADILSVMVFKIGQLIIAAQAEWLQL
tara:strand:+ start:1653 stop:1832 length:180 start_codon:yes stop_codon:yes gene_type:complete